MEWVSVKDRLPKDYQRVLFYDTRGNRSCEADTCKCWTKCNIKGCTWSYETGTKCGNPKHNKNNNK